MYMGLFCVRRGGWSSQGVVLFTSISSLMIGGALEGVVSFTSRLGCLGLFWIQPLPVAGKGRNCWKQDRNDCVRKT